MREAVMTVLVAAEITSIPVREMDLEELDAVQLYSCVFPGCVQKHLESHELYVPELRWIYCKLGAKRRPTHEEITSFGRCRAHMFESVVALDFNRRHDIGNAVTLNLVMEAASKDFLRHMDEKDARRQQRIERRARERSNPDDRKLQLVAPKPKNYGDTKTIVAAAPSKKRSKKKEGVPSPKNRGKAR